jgi:hypothetical protein
MSEFFANPLVANQLRNLRKSPFCGLLATSVQVVQKSSGVRCVAKSALTVLLLSAWLFASLLAASPSLHQYFHHHDSAGQAQSCAALLLKNGQVLAAGALTVLAVLVSLFLFYLPPAESVTVSSPDRRLGFGRAPPFFFCLQ